MSRVTANRIFLKDGLVYMDFASLGPVVNILAIFSNVNILKKIRE